MRPVLWAKDADKDGNCPVAISIAGGGKQTYFNTKIKCPADLWDKAERKIKKGVANYDIKNSRVATLIKDTERELLIRQSQGEVITLELAKYLMNPDREVKGGLFLPFAKELMKGKNASTQRRYNVELSKIEKYKGSGLKFGQITPDWLSAYYKYLLKENSHNTAINAFKVIRHVFNIARKEKLTTLYPFNEWEYPQYKQPKRDYLTMEECDRIYEILNKDYGQEVKLVAAFFLLEAFCGLRVSDWHKFNVETMVGKKEIVFTTKKTDTPIRIPFEKMPSLKKVVEYIRDNNLHYPYKTDKEANDMLRNVIAGAAKIGRKITTHTARHTCASMALNKGMSKTAIAKMLGITERQVDTYAHASSSIIENEIDRIGGF
ncbi:MAG: recombinase [Flavipsychrobacter sp.]|nr:recombinase [Flavipsychrobacter sp.]